MYLWKTTELVGELRANTVSEKDKMFYVLATGLACGLGSDPLFSIGLEYSVLDGINLALMLIVTIVGTLFVYRKNQKGDNRDFVTRFVCLSVPLGVRLIAIALISGFTIGIFESYLSGGNGSDGGNQTTPIQIIFRTAIAIIFYKMLGTHIEAVAAPGDA